ncbi:DsbA family protein [Paracidobacterium acidisoli]|uniref:Thioredoxin-like fold domain-containing protein n=1 Tax=Paracidobacterium acidisoli TaxID=2303751 RepID=A0A372IRA9_9BACT|nr:thioredoxin domain-containing protein [Paracidobacterium acidisoli]MBT9330372.1 DsbA family protein [Paracidobacterium acidisoli]
MVSRRRFALFVLAALFVVYCGLRPAQAQQVPAQVHDTSALKVPPGYHIALVEFADLECPMCAHENPILKQAAEQYHAAWVRHDFPLPMHNWSFQAAVYARWFDTKAKKTGDEYRDAVFANQVNIETKADLQSATAKFAKDRGIDLPFVIDPQGRLEADVRADVALGDRMGVHETPTVWIVIDKAGSGAPNYEQVLDFNKLYSMLDEAQAQTQSPHTVARAKK